MTTLGRLLPASLRNAVGTARYLGWCEYLRARFLGAWYRSRYRRLCPPLEPDQFFVPPDITLRIDPRSRNAFERYTVAEPQVIDELNSFVKMSRDLHCLIDAGAEYGLFSLAFTSRSGARAYALDPSPATLPVLLENVRLNPAHRIEAVNAALGESGGTLQMAFDGIMLHAASTRTLAAGAKLHSVPVVTIDRFSAERGLAPDAIKIDVEGYELAVLRGASETLARCHPTIFLEIHPQDLAATGATAAELFAWLRDRGYRFFSCRARPLDDPARWAGNRVRRLVCVGR